MKPPQSQAGASQSDAADASDTYRALFEKSADAILIIEDGKFVDCNQATVEMLRYSDKEQLLRTHPSALSPATQPDGRDSYEKAEELIKLAFEKGNLRFEWDHVRADGEVFPAEVLLTVIPHGERQLLHVVWRDITERKKLESDLRQAQKMEAIGKLAGGIAHDFNNLLVAILGNAELLEAGTVDSPELQGMAKEIDSAARRAADLTRQLLAFSRKQVLQPKVIDLNQAILGLGELLDRVIGETTELEFRLSAEPLHLEADPGQIDQILLNLVTNARDAMPQGGRIGLETTRVEIAESCEDPALSPGAYALLLVSDSGMGMSQEIVERAFEPFFTTKGLHEGTGLGLSTVFGIVKQNHGSIEVQSQLAQGTKVLVHLPLTQKTPAIEDADAASSATKPGDHALRSRSGESRRILVVEDEPAVSTLMRLVLEKQGYQVTHCANGKEALDVFRADPAAFDLILSDVVMPEITGPELMQRIESEGHHPRVLFASGYMPRTLAQLQLWREGVDLLQKPFTAGELLHRVATALERQPSAGDS